MRWSLTVQIKDADDDTADVLLVEPGEEVILSTPAGCEYLTICTPAYSKAAIHPSKAEQNAMSGR